MDDTINLLDSSNLVESPSNPLIVTNRLAKSRAPVSSVRLEKLNPPNTPSVVDKLQHIYSALNDLLHIIVPSVIVAVLRAYSHIQQVMTSKLHSEPDESVDVDESLIIVEEVPHKTPEPSYNETNLFHSIYPDEVDDSAEYDQYGTSFAISKSLRYEKPMDQSIVSPSFFSLNSTLPYGNELDININLPKPRTEYDAVVSNFYFPLEPVQKHKYSLTNTIVDVTSKLMTTDFFKQERDSILSKITSERISRSVMVKPLKHDQLKTVSNYWDLEAASKVVISDFSIDITIRDLKTLGDLRWLNDNVIDFYFNLLANKCPHTFGWTTHFFTTLQSRGYQGVGRWSKRKKVNVNEKGLVFFPINIMRTHWALAVCDNTLKTFTYYDSLSSSGNLSALRLIKDYMIQEGKKNNSSVDYDLFEMIPNYKTPQQENGSDCGVFTCTFANFIAQDKPLRFSQNDMKNIRRRMAYEIVTKNLLDI